MLWRLRKAFRRDTFPVYFSSFFRCAPRMHPEQLPQAEVALYLLNYCVVALSLLAFT